MRDADTNYFSKWTGATIVNNRVIRILQWRQISTGPHFYV